MMIDQLESLDRAIVVAINGWNTPFLDEFFWIVSEKLTWLPLYLFLIYLYFRNTNFKRTIAFVVCALAVVALTDLISVHLFKNVFMRYRPSHHAELTNSLHFYRFDDGGVYKGGMYGFISSHAANFFGVCLYASFCLRQYNKTLIYWLIGIATLVSFSRIYLGVHYLSDLLVGAMFGSLVAFLVYRYIYTPIDKLITKKV